MIQLLLHLFGDYILQNNTVGTRKKEKSKIGLMYCIFHCITYSIPFLLITNWKACLLIAIGHFLIDRWNVVGNYIKLKNFSKSTKNCGFPEDVPPWMSTWLYIIQDNTLHLIWNYFIILYVGN